MIAGLAYYVIGFLVLGIVQWSCQQAGRKMRGGWKLGVVLVFAWPLFVPVIMLGIVTGLCWSAVENLRANG